MKGAEERATRHVTCQRMASLPLHNHINTNIHQQWTIYVDAVSVHQSVLLSSNVAVVFVVVDVVVVILVMLPQ